MVIMMIVVIRKVSIIIKHDEDYYDYDDDSYHPSEIRLSTTHVKPTKHDSLLSFATSLKQPPSFGFGSLPPNQKDYSKSKLSFVHLIETLLEEDMTSPFALSLLEYIW